MEPSLSFLLIEDNYCIAKSMVNTFSRWDNVNVCHFVKANDAFTYLEQRPVDLVLLNIYLGGEMKGLELIYRIRTRFPIPIILITGEFLSSLPPHLLKLPDFAVLLKPFSPSQLAAMVPPLLGKEFQKIRNKQDPGLLSARKGQ